MNVLFVCTANVCRSPLAAGLLAYNAVQQGLKVNVASASVDDQVRATHPTTVEMLAKRGVDLGRTESQPLTEGIVNGADLVLVMTADHARKVVGRFPTARPKVFVLDHLVSDMPIADSEDLASWLGRVHALPRDYSRETKWDLIDPIDQPPEIYLEVEETLDNATVWIASVLSGIE